MSLLLVLQHPNTALKLPGNKSVVTGLGHADIATGIVSKYYNEDESNNANNKLVITKTTNSLMDGEAIKLLSSQKR